MKLFTNKTGREQFIHKLRQMVSVEKPRYLPLFLDPCKAWTERQDQQWLMALSLSACRGLGISASVLRSRGKHRCPHTPQGRGHRRLLQAGETEGGGLT